MKSTDRHYPPRGMLRGTAAWYIGVGASKFGELVADGRMPAGILIDSCRVWDRFALDDAFDALNHRISSPSDEVQ